MTWGDHNETYIAALREEIDDLQQQLAEAHERQGWQPIETAPKDGTRLLLFSRRPWDRPHVGYYCGPPHGWVTDHGWCGPKPTHWQPLPEPPKEADHA
jgi:hypothetical protein